MKYRFSNPKGVSCGKCIKVCPWNKVEGWTHDLVRWMIDHTPFMNSFFVKMDDLLGYGKPDYDTVLKSLKILQMDIELRKELSERRNSEKEKKNIKH